MKTKLNKKLGNIKKTLKHNKTNSRKGSIKLKYVIKQQNRKLTKKKHIKRTKKGKISKLYGSGPNNNSKPVKFAVFGEGPIGLLCIIYLINYKVANKKNIIIHWYKKRDTYTRRHIVNLSSKLLSEVSLLLSNCNDCLTPNKENELIISILCLEQFLNNYIKQDNVSTTLIKNIKTPEEELIKKYNHVFFADGYSSPHRTKYFYNNENILPLKIIYKNPVLVLYSNMQSIGDECSKTNDYGNKNYILSDTMTEYNLNIDIISSLISIIYRINLWYNQFDESKKSTNLWILGFTDYNNFQLIFDETIKFIKTLNTDDIIKKFKYNGATITDLNIKMLNDINYLEITINNYKNLVKNLLRKYKSLDENFIIHSVMPNCSTFGLILDDKYKNLLFSKKIDNTYLYLIGDSSSAYPPGYSLELGMILVLKWFNILLNKLFNDNLIGNNNLSISNDNNNVKTCNLDDIKFTNGYSYDNKNINKLYSFLDIENIIKKKQIVSDTIIDSYNKLHIDYFFKNIKKISCDLIKK